MAVSQMAVSQRRRTWISLVCDDEFSGKLVFHEIKMDPTRIDLRLLKQKTDAFFAKNPALKGRKVSFRALSVKDM